MSVRFEILFRSPSSKLRQFHLERQCRGNSNSSFPVTLSVTVLVNSCTLLSLATEYQLTTPSRLARLLRYLLPRAMVRERTVLAWASRTRWYQRRHTVRTLIRSSTLI
ncbi:hypothetical protein TYRP_022578 [Tyrophagus putrescentiae]|nr:hypothetical protein TYRP_022578 [Tyrophagus putrescentiae]